LTGSLEHSIARAASDRGLALDADAVTALAAHARLVLSENARLHLTAIDPVEIVPRHIGESLDGAALLDPGIAGLLVDLGSGNGYPGLPVAIARPGLRVVLVEASRKKAEFLRSAIEVCALARASVLDHQVQRGADLEPLEPIDVLTLRAVGGWERILPRLVSRLAPTGRILLWAGAEVERVRTRVVWRKLTVEGRRPHPSREASWIWTLRPAPPSA